MEKDAFRVRWGHINQRSGRTDVLNVPKEVPQRQASQQVWITAIVSILSL
ncbi:hypothetical protein NP493_241g05035 [Ridgeia piscesae]|uniref:Uncharacterized protein n=1 Tax=Ridgeia piscesae TaxID=27915 RepID=A0AAD9UDG4_RIDPI|nr:hypothetical protein NP493_241g05035 [Ridgeia piscesae]